jgi:hypothetical protein
VNRVSEYLVEVYRPRPVDASLPIPTPPDLLLATEKLANDGFPIRLLCSIFVPEEEICFHLFEAESREVVEEAGTLSGLEFESVVEAVWECRGMKSDSLDP